MKCWIVSAPMPDEPEWVTLMHASTKGKAIMQAISYVDGDPQDYIYFRAYRLKKLDDIPITYQAAKDAGFEYLESYYGDPIAADEFINDCPCEICRITQQ